MPFYVSFSLHFWHLHRSYAFLSRDYLYKHFEFRAGTLPLEPRLKHNFSVLGGIPLAMEQ
jgi:hypothetical protein